MHFYLNGILNEHVNIFKNFAYFFLWLFFRIIIESVIFVSLHILQSFTCSSSVVYVGGEISMQPNIRYNFNFAQSILTLQNATGVTFFLMAS